MGIALTNSIRDCRRKKSEHSTYSAARCGDAVTSHSNRTQAIA